MRTLPNFHKYFYLYQIGDGARLRSRKTAGRIVADKNLIIKRVVDTHENLNGLKRVHELVVRYI